MRGPIGYLYHKLEGKELKDVILQNCSEHELSGVRSVSKLIGYVSLVAGSSLLIEGTKLDVNIEAAEGNQAIEIVESVTEWGLKLPGIAGAGAFLALAAEMHLTYQRAGKRIDELTASQNML